MQIDRMIAFCQFLDRCILLVSLLARVFTTLKVTTQVFFLCRLRRQTREGSEDTSRSGQGTASPGTPC